MGFLSSLGSAVGSALGVSGSSRKRSESFQRQPFFTDTGYSTINGRSIRLDPSIRRIQDKALQDYAGTFGDFGNAADRFLTQSSDLRGRTGADFSRLRGGFRDLRGNVSGLRGELSGIGTDLGGVRSSYLGNEGRLMEARLRPIRERFGELSARTQQGLGRRGLGGSSFAIGTLRDIDREQALTESDVRAQTVADSLGFERDILGQQAGLVGQRGQLFGQEAGLIGMEADLASNLANFESQMNAQELDALNNAAQQRANITGETLEISKARILQELGIFQLGETGTGSAREKGYEIGFGKSFGPTTGSA